MRAFAVASALVLAACGSASPATKGRSARPSSKPPSWFHERPKSASSLFFVGDANGASDESLARDLAIQKALAELTVYCGASIKSDFNSAERESNGKSEQVVSLTVDVAGDELTVREAVVRKTEVEARGDGSFDGYALIEWPKREYDGVLRMQRDRGGRALALFLKAEGAARENDTAGARGTIGEARAILGPMKSQVPLEHAEYKNTALLFNALKALSDQLDAYDRERKQVFMVAVECVREGKPMPCSPARAGVIRQAVSRAGRKVSADTAPASVASDILSSSSPAANATLRSAGYVVAVRYTADLQAVEGPFTFIRYGARAVVFDTASGRIMSTEELSPEKEGHPSFEGAMEKGWNAAEKKLSSWIEAQVGRIK